MEKKRFWICTMLLAVALQATPQIRGNAVRVDVVQSHPDWLYGCGQPCTFHVAVIEAGCAVSDVSVDYELGPEMYATRSEKNVRLKDGTLTLTATMKQAGFLRCKVRAHVGDKEYDGLCTVGYEPLCIEAAAQEPSDFCEFWDLTARQARQLPLEPTRVLLPERCTENVNVYEVSFQNLRRGSRIYGILAVPVKPGMYPALLRVPGAGVRPYVGDVQTASRGVVTLEIGIHGVSVTQPQYFYDNLANGALHDYFSQNMDDRDRYYYKRVVTGALRAVDYLCSLPQYNGRVLGVTGSSQGGWLSMVTAALDPRVTFYAAVHPALCDVGAYRLKRACGWFHPFYRVEHPDETALRTMAYYDGINFARRIKVPGWFSFGYNDEVVPPTTSYAAYNAVTAPKELHPFVETGHFWYGEQYDEWTTWLWKQLGVK